jgi:fibrillarin-like rRNA methylase
MAHFAKLGTGNIIEQVEVVSNDIATTEQAGIDFLNNFIILEMFGNKLLITITLEKTLQDWLFL